MFMHNCRKYIFLIMCLITSAANTQSFETIWFDMQSKYNNLKNKFSTLRDLDKYSTDYWKTTAKNFDNLIQGVPDINFLNNYNVGEAMVRTDYCRIQKFEECYLENCLSDKTKSIIKNFKDNDKDLLQKKSTLNCSSSTLGHLFYASKVSENLNISPKTIVEFGGGYGNLSHVFKQIYPEVTIIIFDLLESIALQYLFLKYTNPNIDIIVHGSPIQDDLQKNAIHLVPIYLLNECSFTTDLFISTFAITESSNFVQNLVIQKHFFNANLIYVVGQLNGWKEAGHRWMTDHQNLISAIRNNYKKIQCNPYHIFEENHKSYEMIAIKN